MRLVFASLAAVCAAVVAPLASATPTHVSDVQFINANRCLGLMSSKAIGSADAAAMQRFIKAQSWGRDAAVYDRADQARDEAESDAARNGAEHRAHLVAERDGACQTFIAATNTASATGPAHSLQ